MLDTRSPLIAEFLKDHQQFSKLLFEISKLLKKNEIDQARQRAAELDALAGPHIAYEEAEMYTKLGSLGEQSVTKEFLVGEHHTILSALKRLLDDSPISSEELPVVIAGFDAGLRHAEHCGSLISLMSRLDNQQQTESLSRLIEFRNDGKKWTEL